MAINFILTFDGDWDEYFKTGLPDNKRCPPVRDLLVLLERELAMAATVGGKCIHFVHTSPLFRDLFLKPEFLAVWKRFEAAGGEAGVHCHEEELYKSWYFNDADRMDSAITQLADGLKTAGLTVCAYRGGFMTFSPRLIPFLQRHGLLLDFSCDPGRHLFMSGQLVADWRGAPASVYRMDSQDPRRPGASPICEVPLGIYIEKQSLFSIWNTCRRMNAAGKPVLVSVLAHTYDFTSPRMRFKIWCALRICRFYGSFINTAQARDLIKELGI